MKDKILTLIIGILIGAIISSAGFVIYIKTNKTNNVDQSLDMGNPPQMSQGRGAMQNDGTLPELPNGEMPNGNEEMLPEQKNGEKSKKRDDTSTKSKNDEKQKDSSKKSE